MSGSFKTMAMVGLVALLAPACGGAESTSKGGGSIQDGGTGGDATAGTGGTAGGHQGGHGGNVGGSAGSHQGNGGGHQGGNGGGHQGGMGGGHMGGSGGVGPTEECGADTCEPYGFNVMGYLDVNMPACCAGAGKDKCGLNVDQLSSFVKGISGCMELDQPGAPSAACPDKLLNMAGQSVPLPGCCRPTGTCGVEVNVGELAGSFGAPPGADFGCVDKAPFLEPGDPPVESCTP